MPAISVLPTLSSSTPLTDWFANVNQMHNLVQNQAAIIHTLQERLAVLESRANIQPPTTVIASETTDKKVKKPRKVADKAKAGKTLKEAKASENTTEVKEDTKEKKRGRKPAEVNLGEFLREGEQIIARIPLGDRQFDEHAVTFREGKLVLEDGQMFDHPTTLVATLAKILEDIGERSTECSRSMNGWILCSVSRDGKRVPLEKIKPVAETTETTEAIEAS